MRTLIYAILLTMQAEPVFAADRFYCSMQEFLTIEDGEAKRYRVQSFLMSVDKQEVKFSGGKFMHNWSLKTYPTNNPLVFDAYAYDRKAAVKFTYPHFYYANVDAYEVVSFYATCEER